MHDDFYTNDLNPRPFVEVRNEEENSTVPNLIGCRNPTLSTAQSRHP